MHGPKRAWPWAIAAAALSILVATGAADPLDARLGRWGPLALWSVVTELGSVHMLGAVAALAAAALWLERRREEAVWMALVWGIATVATFTLKDVFGRPRPDGGAFVVDLEAFPSGHALIGLAVYGAWALLAAPEAPRAWHVMAGLGLMVGLSRLALGVHHLTDVLAGWCMAMLLLAVMQAIRRSSSRPGRGGGRPAT